MKGSASVMVRAVRNQCLVSLMFFCVILKSQPFADALARLSTRLRAATLEQIRVGWNRQRRSTDPVNLLYLFEVDRIRSEEHTSELQSLMRISYAVFCLKKKKR